MALLLNGTTHDSSGSIWQFVVPALIVSLFLLPIALWDMLAFSNQFAGPLVNFRGRLKQLLEKESSEEIRLRKGDFCSELCEQLNQLRTMVVAEEQPVSEAMPRRNEFCVSETK